MTRRCLLACLLLLLVAGCGASAADKRKHAVNDYLDRVNRAETQVVSQSATIDAALRAFTPGGTTPAELGGLVRARATLRDALGNVRALQPPLEAVRLHRDIVRLLALEASVTNELVWSARFIPQLAAAVQPVGAAAAALARDLGTVTTNSVAVGAVSPRLPARPSSAPTDVLLRYASAFARYRKALEPISRRLDRLSAPPALAPDLAAEQRAVRRSVLLGAAIERALLDHDIPAANAGIRALFDVAKELKSVRTQKAEAAAVRAYDRRLVRITKLAAAVATERQRLVQTVG